jgi:hypothetical protein
LALFQLLGAARDAARAVQQIEQAQQLHVQQGGIGGF